MLRGIRQDLVRYRGDYLRGIGPRALGIPFAEANIEPDVAPFTPAQVLHSLAEGGEARLSLRVLRGANQHADAPHGFALLGASRERPCRRCADQ